MRHVTYVFASLAAVLWLGGVTIYLSHMEVPTGRLTGRAVAQETGNALPRTLITLERLLPANDEDSITYTFRTDRDGQFDSGRLPAGAYRLEAVSRAHELARMTLDLKESETRDLTLTLDPDAPFLELRMPHRLYLPEENPVVTAHGFSLLRTLTFGIYRVDVPTLLKQYSGHLNEFLNEDEKLPEKVLAAGKPGLSRVSRTTQTVTARDIEGIFTQRFPLPLHTPGLYVIDAATGDATPVHRLEWIAVSRIGLIAKHWGDDALAYVADLKTGAPVPGARVQFAAQGVAPVSGLTDAEGMFRARVTGRGTRGEIVGLAEKDGSQTYITFWSYPDEGGDGQERVYCYTDRPVYRPGHVVYFKGILRTIANDSYHVPASKSVQVEVQDSRETLVYRGRLITDAYGSFHGSFLLSDQTATGYYSITTTVDGRPHESGFKVAEYRKPEYRVEVKTDKERYTRGEEIHASVSAQYYFGAPVAGAKVEYEVMQSPYWFSPESDEDLFRYGDGGADEYDDYGEVVLRGTTTTDAQGVAHLTLPTREVRLKPGDTEQLPPQDLRYIISATVTDPSRKAVSEEASAIVTQGDFELLAQPLDWIIRPGKPARVQVQSLRYDGRPVPKATVSVSVRQEKWRRHKLELGEETGGSVTTDARGRALYTFTPPEAGSYHLRFSATDPHRNRITADSYLWVTEETYSDLEVEYPDLEIVTDKKSYQKGDTAVLLINTRRKGGTALLTVEGLRLYDHRLIELKGNTTRVELPLKPEYAPNCYVSVTLIRNKQYAEQEKQIVISEADRKLQVRITADKPSYHPGDRVTYTIVTRDAQGRPVPAEASLGVVDESIYAVQEEMVSPILRFFYPPRENAVETDYSFASIYLDADKEPATIRVRRRFPDTAYWNPTVLTDQNGRATLSFSMPDTLTTWRATVRAATLDTEVGEATTKVRTSKDLLVRLEMPRFAVQDDRVTISALVHSFAPQRQEVQVWPRAPGLTFADVRATRPVSFALSPGGRQRQDWVVQAAAVGRPEVTAFVRARSGLSDAMALPLPVRPHGREQVETRSGVVQERATAQFTVRDDAVAGATNLRLRLAPSVAAVMFGALDYLATYPWGCTEQTVSAFLPDVVLSQSLHELHLRNPRVEQRLPDLVRRGFDRLYGSQHDDGGWGWCRYGESDPWMTSYVVYALLVARRAGLTVNPRALHDGLDWLAHRLSTAKEPSLRNRAYIVRILALAGKRAAVGPELDTFLPRLSTLDTVTLANLTAALLALGRTKEARTAADLLWARAAGPRSLLHWKAPPPNYRLHEMWMSDTETTALAFQALSAITPDDPRLPGVVRWLALSRRGNHWCATRDTAFVIYALTPYLKRTGELHPDYQTTVAVNGKPIWSKRLTQADVFAPETEVRVAPQLLRKGTNRIGITKSGVGQLYYTGTLTQYASRGLDRPQNDSDVTVERQYFRIRAARDPRTGALRTFPEAQPTTDFRVGEPILVRLTLEAATPHDSMLVEDPLPAGCEVSERGDLEPWEWDQWYTDIDVRDDRAAFFIDLLPARPMVIEYHLQPQIPGLYHALPPSVYSMYDPSVRSSGTESLVTLR